MFVSVVPRPPTPAEPEGEHDEYETEEIKKESIMSVSQLMDLYENSCIQIDKLKSDIKELDVSINHLFKDSIEAISTEFQMIHQNITVLERNGLHAETCNKFRSHLMSLLNYLINRSSMFSLQDTRHQHKHVIGRLNVIIVDLHRLLLTEWKEHSKDMNLVLLRQDNQDIDIDINFEMDSTEFRIEEQNKRCCCCDRTACSEKGLVVAVCVFIVMVLLVILFTVGGVKP
jgi:hypothetical protein